MTQDCLFCRIIRKEIPGEVVDESPFGVVIRDINPEAPVHLLVLPKRHVGSLADADDAAEMGDLMMLGIRAAAKEGIVESGFRTVINTGRNGGQAVGHLHIHVMGGRKFTWPPG